MDICKIWKIKCHLFVPPPLFREQSICFLKGIQWGSYYSVFSLLCNALQVVVCFSFFFLAIVLSVQQWGFIRSQTLHFSKEENLRDLIVVRLWSLISIIIEHYIEQTSPSRGRKHITVPIKYGTCPSRARALTEITSRSV